MSGLEPLELQMPAIAEAIWGQPRDKATATEIRYGDGRTVNPQKGRWWVHGEEVGGGPLKLLEHALGLKGKPAFDWLREHGFDVDDAPERAERVKPAQKKAEPEGKREVVAERWYVDEDGRELFQTVRIQFKLPDGTWLKGHDGKVDKTFTQRRRPREGDPPEKIKNGWVWSIKDCGMVPYRLPELLQDIAAGATIFFVEGEKAADRLRDAGIPATTNPMGAGKWWPELTRYFKDADVVVLPDNDPQSKNRDGDLLYHENGKPKFVGRDHADAVAGAVLQVARRVRLLDLPDLPLKGDAFDWFENGGTADALYDLVDSKAIDWQPDRTFRPKLSSVLWKDLDSPGPEHEWLIEDVLTVGEVSMIAGPSRHGKSFAAVDEGLAVSRGEPWLGNATLRGGVIYIAAESGRGVKKRLRAYRAWNEIKPETELPFVLLPGQFDLYGAEDHTNALLEDAKLWDTYFKETFGVPLRLIIIDTFAAATPGADENSSRDVGTALKRATLIANTTGANVQLVHHMNAGGTKPRGWTGILANIDTVLTIEKHDKRVDEDGRPIRFATMSKNKDGEDGRSWRFVLRQIEIGKDKRGKAVTSCVCVPPKEDIDSEREADGGIQTTDNDRQFLFCVREAIRNDGEHPPNELKCPARIKRVVDVVKAGALFRERYSAGETGTEEQVRTRLGARWKRAHDRMVQYGVIGSSRPWLWLTGKPVKGMRLSDDEPRQRSEPGDPGPDLLADIDAIPEF